jgi:hypothetical protein
MIVSLKKGKLDARALRYLYLSHPLPAEKIIVINRHPLLNTGIIDNNVEIIVLLRDPFE